MYRRALRQTHQLDALEADLIDRRPKVVGLVIDEVDDRLHKERSKKDVAMWIGNWLTNRLRRPAVLAAAGLRDTTSIPRRTTATWSPPASAGPARRDCRDAR